MQQKEIDKANETERAERTEASEKVKANHNIKRSVYTNAKFLKKKRQNNIGLFSATKVDAGISKFTFMIVAYIFSPGETRSPHL